MATHSSILAWRIPWPEEPGGLLSMGSHRVGHDRSDLALASVVKMASLAQWERICLQCEWGGGRGGAGASILG